MRNRAAGRQGQNTVEYLMMLSVVVGVVLISGAALKKFMPSLFGNVQQMIAGAASGAGGGSSGGSSGGSGGSSTGGGTATTSGASSPGAQSIASASNPPGALADGAGAAGGPISSFGADGGSRAEQEGGHPPAKGVGPNRTP